MITAHVVTNNRGEPVVVLDSILITDLDGKDNEEQIANILTLADDYEMAFRVYATGQGLRVVCTSDLIRAKAPVAKRLLEDLGSDPRYIKCVEATGTFSGRIGARSTRVGLKVPQMFCYYALLPKEQRAWDAQYSAVAGSYRACEFLLQTEQSQMPSEIANFIALHDERTQCFSNLPMA